TTPQRPPNHEPGNAAPTRFQHSSGHLPEECLNQHWFTSIDEAREIIEDRRIDCNTECPHSSLKYQIPEEFAAAKPFDKTQWAQPLELLDGSAPAPIAHA
ncbi:integrase core domain-containing protein, partial [Paracoccus bogoriensis]|uniref:integrase core domain-containing protein n=1 Tax=Paracoccus bogoriensis TaxID=242065 RepID=UPI001CA4AEF8